MLQVTINLSIILELRAKSICALWTKSNSNYTINKLMSQESILHIYSEVILQWVQDYQMDNQWVFKDKAIYLSSYKESQNWFQHVLTRSNS